MSKTITKFNSKDNDFEERIKKKGGFVVIISDEPCFTCGHKTLMVYPEKTDGRTEIKYDCLYCLTSRSHTAANRSGN